MLTDIQAKWIARLTNELTRQQNANRIKKRKLRALRAELRRTRPCRFCNGTGVVVYTAGGDTRTDKCGCAKKSVEIACGVVIFGDKPWKYGKLTSSDASTA